MNLASNIIVLDRDGVINHDSPNYIRSPEEFEPIAGSLEAIAELNRAGHPVALATNQSAVARGYVALETLEAIHRKLSRLLAEVGGRLDHIAFCPHSPDDRCRCRKPEPGLLHQIADRFGVQPAELTFIGDSATDMEAAQRARARGILVRTGNGRHHEGDPRIVAGTEVYDDLSAAVRALLDRQLVGAAAGEAES